MLRRVATVLVLAAVSLLAAACTNGDDAADVSDPGAEQAADEGAEAPTGDPIKLMVVFEGSAGIAQPEQSKGALAAAEAINRAGGLDGRPVEIIECDTGNDPNTAAECGRQAVDEDVMALVGSFSVHADQFMPLLEQNRIPSIGNNPATVADFTSPASFPITGGAVSTFGTLPVALVDEGATTISLARVDLGAAAALSGFADTALAPLGTALVADVPVPFGAPDMSPYVASATEGDVDGVVVGMAGQDALNFVVAAKQADPDLLLGVVATQTEELVDSLGEGVEDIIFSTTIFPEEVDTEANAQFTEDMDAAGFERSSGLSYASVKVIEALYPQLGEATNEALWELLPMVEDLDIGLLPPIQFVEGGAGGIPRIFNPCELAVRAQLDGDEVTGIPIWDSFRDPFSGSDCPTPPGLETE